MGEKDQVEHEGIIKKISVNSVKVGFIKQPSCNGCYVKDICNLEQRSNEVIEIVCSDIRQFSVGDKVKIKIRQSIGLKAVLIAYFFPFLLIIVSLFIMTPLLKQEIKAAIISLLMLVPYYLIIYIYRNKIKKEINFTLEKI